MITLPPAPPAPKALPKIHILKYLPLPILIIGLSIALYAVNKPTNTSTQASLGCPIYDISPSGTFYSSNPNRKVQVSINGSPMTQPIQLPPEGIYTWQVVDDQNCRSSGTYTPTPILKPNVESLPPLIPTLAK